MDESENRKEVKPGAEANRVRSNKITIKDYEIFIDTSSLLYDGADTFWANIVPYLKKELKIIRIPYEVYAELKHLAADPDYCAQRYPDNPNLNMTAKKRKIK